ncbi:MAG: hypothetical protein ACR2I2_00370 [Bryobacteraceae bacterium]
MSSWTRRDLLALIATGPIRAQFRTEVTLVMAPTSVGDKRGKPVRNLKESDFFLADNGRLRVVRSNETAQPVSLVVAVASALKQVEARGSGSSFVDAVMRAASLLESRPPERRRVAVVIAEARDRTSKTDLKRALIAIEKANVTVYALTYSPYLMDFGKEVPRPSGPICTTNIYSAFRQYCPA